MATQTREVCDHYRGDDKTGAPGQTKGLAKYEITVKCTEQFGQGSLLKLDEEKKSIAVLCQAGYTNLIRTIVCAITPTKKREPKGKPDAATTT